MGFRASLFTYNHDSGLVLQPLGDRAMQNYVPVAMPSFILYLPNYLLIAGNPRELRLALAKIFESVAIFRFHVGRRSLLMLFTYLY